MSRPESLSFWSIGAACAGLVAFSVASCSSGAVASSSETVGVVSYSPRGTTANEKPEIEIRFDRAVVPFQAVGALVEPLPVAIDPPIDARARWTDRRTLVVTPTTDLAPTRYVVSLTDELAENTNGFGFGFVHEPLAGTPIAR